MRKIIAITMITLDGVMQAPGGPEEDKSNGFQFGGWTAPYADDNGSEFFEKNMQPAEYLLGRKTAELSSMGGKAKAESLWELLRRAPARQGVRRPALRSKTI